MPKSLEEEKVARHKYYLDHIKQFKTRYRRHYEKNAGQLEAYQRKYYEEHKDYVKARERKYAHEHLEDTRAKRMARQREYRLKNPEYNRKKCREYYVAHREKEIQRRIKDIQRGKQKLYEYKATLNCSRCGRSFPDCPAVIDLHHKGEDPKLKKVNLLVGASGLSSKRVQAELAKCIPLCANCHRIVHDIEKEDKEKGLVRSPVKKSSIPLKPS
jgi:hypothetical protein